jgi:lysyl-tRNA synthetase class I
MPELWPLAEAMRLLKAPPKGDHPYIFQTGFGPSGLPVSSGVEM